MIDMVLTRRYYDVKGLTLGSACSFSDGCLTVCEGELIEPKPQPAAAVTAGSLN